MVKTQDALDPAGRNFSTPKERLLTEKKVKADEVYLRESILEPDAKIVEGFADSEVAMPPYKGILTDSQIESLVLFIKSL